MTLPNKKYNIIYADPPWHYNNDMVTKHYQVCKIEQLKNIPINNIVCDNSVLFMWATFPNLLVALELGKEWGFEYKTVAFTWVKQNKKNDNYFMGPGFYTRANAEICLLFKRGKTLERKSKSVRQLCVTRRREHSRKPDEIRDRIIELYGNELPKIELFARERINGWDAWGNEIDKF